MLMEVVGFWGDLYGMESEVFEAPPVICVNGKNFIARELDWSLTDSLEEFDSNTSQYVTLFSERNMFVISEGDTVWFTGPEVCSRLGLFSLDSSSEKTAFGRGLEVDGFRWVCGSRSEFQRARSDLADISREQLHSTLFGRTEVDKATVEDIFLVFTAATPSPTKDDFLDRAVYFDVFKQTDYYSFLRAQAVMINQVFESEIEFDRAVSEHKNLLADDVYPQRIWTSVAANLRETEADAKAVSHLAGTVPKMQIGQESLYSSRTFGAPERLRKASRISVVASYFSSFARKIGLSPRETKIMALGIEAELLARVEVLYYDSSGNTKVSVSLDYNWNENEEILQLHESSSYTNVDRWVSAESTMNQINDKLVYYRKIFGVSERRVIYTWRPDADRHFVDAFNREFGFATVARGSGLIKGGE